MPAYQVINGDTLNIISEKVYGTDAFAQDIAAANNITDKDVIAPGMLLKLPDHILPEVVKTASRIPWGLIVSLGAIVIGIVVDKMNKNKTKKKP